MSHIAASFRIESIGPESPLLRGKCSCFTPRARATSAHFPRARSRRRRAGNGSWWRPLQIIPWLGYVVYRVAKNRAAITHLTASKVFHGQGVARSLMEALKLETKHLAGISLKCRRDYNLSDMWTGFGFTVRHTREGRGTG